MDGLKQHPERRAWLMAHAGEYGLIPLDEYDEGGYEGYEHYDGYKSGENFHFSDNEEPFDASAVSASGGGGGHWESAYDPVRLEKVYKMIDAEDAGARSALQAKEDTYTENFIEQLRGLHDGAAAVAMIEEHRDEFTTRGLSKINNAMGLIYPGALTAAHRNANTSVERSYRSNGTEDGGEKLSASTVKELATMRYKMDSMASMIGGTTEETKGETFQEDNSDFEDYRHYVQEHAEILHNAGLIGDTRFWNIINELNDIGNARQEMADYWGGKE